jgi:hypothetical protein
MILYIFDGDDGGRDRDSSSAQVLCVLCVHLSHMASRGLTFDPLVKKKKRVPGYAVPAFDTVRLPNRSPSERPDCIIQTSRNRKKEVPLERFFFEIRHRPSGFDSKAASKVQWMIQIYCLAK